MATGGTTEFAVTAGIDGIMLRNDSNDLVGRLCFRPANSKSVYLGSLSARASIAFGIPICVSAQPMLRSAAQIGMRGADQCVEGGVAGVYQMPSYDDAVSLYFYDRQLTL